MKTWSFYHQQTGLLLSGRLSLPAGSADLQANTPAWHIAIEGCFDELSQRIDPTTGQPVDYQPPAPADDIYRTWTWDATAKRNVATPTLAARRIQRQVAVGAQIEELERQQPRPLRNLMSALMQPVLTAEQAAERDADLQRLRAIEDAINALRAKWQQLQAATTSAQLDAVPA